VEVDTLALFYGITVTARDGSSAFASTGIVLTIQPRRVDLATGISAQPEPTTVGTAPQWSLQVTNVSRSASEPAGLTADWYSTGGPVTLTTTASCVLTAATQVQCDIPALAPGDFAVVRVEGEQSAPGDQAVIARLDVSDSNGANNAVFKSLNVAGSFNQSPAQRLSGSSDLASAILTATGISISSRWPST
jgi:hypothetical protein